MSKYIGQAWVLLITISTIAVPRTRDASYETTVDDDPCPPDFIILRNKENKDC